MNPIVNYFRVSAAAAVSEDRMEEKQESPWFGCLAIVALIALVGSCVMGGDDEPVAEEASSTSVTPSVPEAGDPSSPSDQALPSGSNMLEQAILDAFPTSAPKTSEERERTTNALAFVGLAINAKGHLCARVVEAQQAAPGQYGIGCVMNRDGTGAAIYLLDTRTGNVTPIG
jgi:hypothetical protein